VSSRDDLLRSYESGNFLETVYACLGPDPDERSDLGTELVTLHNDGEIDVVGAFESLSNNSPNGPNCFLTRHVFEKALPDINSPVLPVMRCILRLYRQAGQDFAAGTIIEGYVEFCAKQTSRPHDALAEIEAYPSEFAGLLTATLSAGFRIDKPHFLNQALRLCEGQNVELSRGAVLSLGNLNLSGDTLMPEDAIVALERIAAKETDDLLLANLVKSAFALLQQNMDQEQRLSALITAALSKGDEYTLYAASEIFGFHTSELPEALLDVLLIHLARVMATNKGSLDNIDYGISHLLKNDFSHKAIKFLEDYLLAHPDELAMNVFDNAAREILGNKALISKVLTRWFLRGERVLGDSIYWIVSHNQDDLPLETDPSELPSTEAEHLFFLARKTIGYLFMQQICAASLLISLMRHAKNDETLTTLGSLLFDPLLLNYTGKTREYVEQQSAIESGKVKATLCRTLKAVDNYLVDLQSVGNLAALYPSEAQREAYHRYFSRSMAESMEDAQSQSAILQLVSKSVLLYGRASINYVYRADGQSHRTETPLHLHGVEMEFPRMENLDPFGLNYMLRIFRNERLST